MSTIGLLVNMINAQPPIQQVNRSPYLGQKVSEHEADHSPPTRSEVKFCGSIPPLPTCLQDKHRNNSISIMTPLNTLPSGHAEMRDYCPMRCGRVTHFCVFSRDVLHVFQTLSGSLIASRLSPAWCRMLGCLVTNKQTSTDPLFLVP